ncbi:MAG TPA: hypothetical protein VE079_16500 [Ensifer sp.]|nr:hypothetical protein [Ensifer sp.]
MAIQPERHEGESKVDAVDAAINARLTRHLIDNALKESDVTAEPPQATGLGERLLVASGLAFLMSVLGLYSVLDRRRRFL